MEYMMKKILMTAAVFVLLTHSCAKKYTPADRFLTFSSGRLTFQAQFTRPAGIKSKRPAFLILDGPGREDMDRSTHAFRKTIRPFRDLAVHLAEAGCAVLRFDKRTFLKKRGKTPFRLMAKDAAEAYALLKSQPETDPKRIHLIAFGNGAVLVPELVSTCKFRSVFLLNPVLERIDRHLLFKLHYQLDFYRRHRLRSRLKPVIRRTRILLARAGLAMQQLKNPDIADDTALLGFSKKFWKAWVAASIRLPERLAALHTPMIILQGSRDLQSPAGLVRQKSAVIRSSGKKIPMLLMKGMRHDLYHNPTGSFMTPMIKKILKNI